MARKARVAGPSSGYTVLLVDDSDEYRETTALLLEREGHKVLRAAGGAEALAIAKTEAVDLVLLDYFMPGMTGEEVVVALRTFDPHVQVILQTGYASEQPPRDLLKRLDIQGYFDKTEGPDKLLLWADVGLKSAYAMQMLNRSRQGLRYILDVTPDLHRLQPLEHLLQGVLLQISGLLGATNSFVAVRQDEPPAEAAPASPSGFVAVVEEESDLVIRASTGSFSNATAVTTCLPTEVTDLIRVAMHEGKVQMTAQATIVPLRVGDAVLGVVYMDRRAGDERDLELVQVFANQAAVAIQNAQLYEMATVDRLTGVYVRRFFEQWFLRELRLAFRTQAPLSLLVMDLDHFKQINDTAGHQVGDQALSITGRVLRESVRAGDVIGRFGGDEFALLLPGADEERARRVADRVLELLSRSGVESAAGNFPLAGSMGLGVLPPHPFTAETLPRPLPAGYFQSVADALFKKADEALYRGKRDGGSRVELAGAVEWPRP